MGKRILTVLISAALAVLAVGCVLPSAKGDAVSSPELVLRYADDQPEGHPATKAAHFFAELVYNKTGGRIQIEVCPGGQLGDEKSVVEQVSFGGIDFARVSLSAMQDLVPSSIALQMPYSYRNAAHMWAVLDGSIGERFLKKLEAADIVGLSWYDAGARSFYSSKPIRCFLDMQGLQIGIQEDDIVKTLVQEFGATPKMVVYSDVMSCLQAGVIDAAENSLTSYQSAGHYRPAPYFLKTEHLRIPELQIVSQVTWNEITPEDQEIIRRCARESAQYQRALWRVRESEAEAELMKAGCTITTVSAAELEKFRQKAGALYVGLTWECLRIVREIDAVQVP